MMRRLLVVALLLVASSAVALAQPPATALPACEARLRAERMLRPDQTCEQALRAALALIGHLERQRRTEEHGNAFAHSQKDALVLQLRAEAARLRAEVEQAKKTPTAPVPKPPDAP